MKVFAHGMNLPVKSSNKQEWMYPLHRSAVMNTQPKQNVHPTVEWTKAN